MIGINDKACETSEWYNDTFQYKKSSAYSKSELLFVHEVQIEYEHIFHKW